MLYPPFKLTAYNVWLRCMPADDPAAQKTFWSDIVLFLKANQGKSVFFEELVRQVCPQDEAQQSIKLPLPLLVDSLVRTQEFFDDELWSEVITEWTKLKIDLKIKAQTIILQKDELIKKFLAAVLGKSKNPRPLIRQIAKDSGLLKDYSKNDVIMMLCSIVAESLKYQMDMKETDHFMQEGVFQMEEELEETMEAKAQLLISEQSSEPAQCSLSSTSKHKELQTLWDLFLSELADVSPLDESWQDTELYVIEVQDLAAKKMQECEEIIRRRQLLGEFTNKADYLSDVFRIQLNELDLALPESSAAEAYDNVCLEHATELMSKLQQVMQKYKELSASKKTNLTEEKKRVGQLFTVMTDIENFIDQLSITCAGVTAAPSEQPALEQAAEQTWGLEQQTETKLQEVMQPQADDHAVQQATSLEEDEEQIELFLGK